MNGCTDCGAADIFSCGCDEAPTRREVAYVILSPEASLAELLADGETDEVLLTRLARMTQKPGLAKCVVAAAEKREAR